MIQIPFDNRFAALGEGYFARSDPAPVRQPELIRFNDALARELGIDFNCSGLGRLDESFQSDAKGENPWRKCFRPCALMYITAQGNVLPCCIAPFATVDYESIILGNVFETPLEEIWTGDRYTQFRKRHRSSTPPKCCLGCGTLWSL